MRKPKNLTMKPITIPLTNNRNATILPLSKPVEKKKPVRITVLLTDGNEWLKTALMRESVSLGHKSFNYTLQSIYIEYFKAKEKEKEA